jgi:hypothetical protein
VFPKELRLEDVVCYAKETGSPFNQMKVVARLNTGILLRRPYIGMDGEAHYEEAYFPYESDFKFKLIQRY